MNNSRRWTEKEAKDLARLYNKIDNEALIEHFSRTYLSIYKKARAMGLYKTKEMEFINRSMCRKGSLCSGWRGGRKKNSQGYIYAKNERHHRATSDGYVLEHIVVMENYLGRRINVDEAVHHVNGIRDDNRIENLEVMSKADHTKLHHVGKTRSKEARKRISEGIRQSHNNKKMEALI